MQNSFEQVRPSPQFERETPSVPATTTEQPDLEALARELHQMKIDARVDAERTRPGLNGFLVFIVVTAATYIFQFVAEYGTEGFRILTHTPPLDDPAKLLIAGGAGVIIGANAAILSFLDGRRTQRSVEAFEGKLVALGGVPLDRRGE